MTADEIQPYYNQGKEENRLLKGTGQVELARTQEIIRRYLSEAPGTVLDIGGGAGIYALWLARLGYAVHLVDVVPLHIEQAQQAAAQQPDHPLASAEVGNALSLNFEDNSADSVLLLGPLYHLPDREERLIALREAYRVLKPGGWLFAATISRYASLFEGLMRGYMADTGFAQLVEQDIIDGQHRNPTQQKGYFTTAFFHHPDEIRAEVIEANFELEALLAVEGPAAFMPDFEQFWKDNTLRNRVLDAIRTLETEPTILGATGHMMAIGRKE